MKKAKETKETKPRKTIDQRIEETVKNLVYLSGKKTKMESKGKVEGIEIAKDDKKEILKMIDEMKNEMNAKFKAIRKKVKKL